MSLDIQDLLERPVDADIALSDEMRNGSFDTCATTVHDGLVSVPGVDDYQGWTLIGREEGSARDGYQLMAPPPADGRVGPIVGFVALNRNGTWTAYHDPHDPPAGMTSGGSGDRVETPSAEAAYRHVVVSQTRHEKRHPR